MNESGNMEYSKILYEIKKLKNYNKKYGALVLFPIPINFLIIPFIPIYIRSASQSLNLFLVKLGYCILLLVFSLAFILGNLFIIPICWLKMLFNIVTVKYRLNKSQKNPGFNVLIIHFTLWLFFGLLYLVLILLINDLPLFFKSAFEFCDNEFESLPIKDYFFHLFTNLIDELNKENIKTISYEEFHKAYFEIIEVMLGVRQPFAMAINANPTSSKGIK